MTRNRGRPGEGACVSFLRTTVLSPLPSDIYVNPAACGDIARPVCLTSEESIDTTSRSRTEWLVTVDGQKTLHRTPSLSNGSTRTMHEGTPPRFLLLVTQTGGARCQARTLPSPKHGFQIMCRWAPHPLPPKSDMDLNPESISRMFRSVQVISQ